jgi:hypothetical protein
MAEQLYVQGLKELEIKLSKLEQKLAAKTLKSAMTYAVSPVKRQMKMAAPVGKEPHRSYKKIAGGKGRLLPPGFLKKSIKHITRVDKRRGTISAFIGVKSEAFYGVQFLDVRDYKVQTKPLPHTPWFKTVFEANAQTMVDRFRYKLREKVEAAAR